MRNQLLVLFIFSVVVQAATFVGPNTPEKYLSEKFSEIDMKGVIQDQRDKKTTPPGTLRFLETVQTLGGGSIGKNLLDNLPTLPSFTLPGFGASLEDETVGAAAQSLISKATATQRQQSDPGVAAGQKVSDPDSGAIHSVDPLTGIISIYYPKTQVTTTRNPATNETTSQDPVNKMYSYFDPIEQISVSININSQITIEVNTTTGETITHNKSLKVIGIVNPITGMSIVHNIPTNTTKVTNPIDNETRTIQIEKGLFSIEFTNEGKVVLIDLKQKTISTTTTVNGVKKTIVAVLTPQHIEEYHLLDLYLIPDDPFTVEDILETVKHPKTFIKPPTGAKYKVVDGALTMVTGSTVNLGSSGATSTPTTPTRTGTVGTTAKTTGTAAPTTVTIASTSTAPTKTTGTTTTTKITTGTTTGAKTAAGNTSQTATVSAKASQDMVDKYVAEEKGNAKASAIVTTKVDVVSNQCTKGECCDSSTGKYKAAGQTCYSSPCSSASACLGVSSTCPPSSTYLPDGSVCPNGVCQLGICIPSSAAEKVKALLSSTTTTTIPTVTTTAPKRHSVSNPSSSPSSTSLGRHKFYAFDNKIKCKQGGCCDLKTGFVKLAGTSCTESKHECYEESGKCNGFEYKCPRKAKANGTECSIGQCMNGICKKENAALASSAVSSSGETLSKVNMKKNEDLDISLNLLEEKIQKAKERQEKIKSDILDNKKEEQRNLIRSTLKNIHQQVKSELDLSKRNVLPYQTTTTKAQALDNKKSDFNIHDYIRQIHEEENRYNSNTLSKATANLQSSNNRSSFPWFFVGAFVIFVAVVALIVAIVKVVGGKKNKQKIDKEDYENF